MKVENKVMPNEKQMEEFLEEGNDEPIFMAVSYTHLTLPTILLV